MITSNLDQLMLNHKIRSIAELSRQTDLNRRTLTNLYDGKSKGIEWTTLATLCRFFNCTVGDLLEYVE